jgi:dihydroneopterin aldolase
MKIKITLETMKFHAYHGVMEQERIVGGDYLVDVFYVLDTKSVDTDRITDTVSYAGIFDCVKKEMEIPSNLIENVAGKILKTIQLQYPQIMETTVKVTKLHPPVAGEAGKATVTLTNGNFL